MKLKSVVFAAAALAIGASAAMANDVVTTVPVVDWNATFSAVHTDSNYFHDAFTFDVSGSYLATVSGITISLLTEQDIDFAGASLNGQALTHTFTPGDALETFYTPTALSVTGPLVLKVWGTTHATSAINSSYTGNLNIAAVPEPETYALMAAGLGVMGFIARRRRKN